MGEGLKKVCKQCGGLKVTGKDGKTVEYDKEGKPKKKKGKKRLETYESFVNNFLNKINETGEPDLDYNNPEMDNIVESLEKEGFEAEYAEFDKYQGVYLTISKGGKSEKFWWTDTYSTGIWSDGYVSSQLIDDNNESSSGNAGDYWNLPKDYVFQDHTLIYKIRKDGKVETKRIENPKVTDLPDITGKRSEFTSKQEIMEFTVDGSGETFQYMVGSGDVSQFVEHFENN